jgi:hypothetical protein
MESTSTRNVFGFLCNLYFFVRVGKKSSHTHAICIKNQFKFTQHNTHHNVEWQFGYSIEDNAYMVAIARVLVLLVWLTQAVTVSRSGWWPFAPLLHKCSKTCHRRHGDTSTCVSSIKVHIWIHRTCNEEVCL